MNSKRRLRRVMALFLALVITVVSALPLSVVGAEERNIDNRFNVVVVLDASNSMNYTDPSGFRYEAVKQFVNLLTAKGNVLGGIVFSNHITASQEPMRVDSQEGRDKVVSLLESVMSHGVTDDMGYTNIGEGLSAAVDMINKNGNSDLPSVIVFLSDGNTEMPTEDELAVSLNQKADAIQHARECGIGIYSVCLNANSNADTSEMEQISQATGGVFREVSTAEDLQDVFSTFYTLIYGTASIALVDAVFPPDGRLETPFDVPGIGVEEVNIVINGETTALSLIDPAGVKKGANVVSSLTFTLVKLTDVVPGRWMLVTEGIPGDQIRVNMIYNTNLGVDIETDPAGTMLALDDPLSVYAALRSGSVVASRDEQYTGYSAEIQIKNAYGELLEAVPMAVKNGRFEADCPLKEGAYFIGVHVTGHYLDRNSEDIGPLTVAALAPTPTPKKNVGDKEENPPEPEPVINEPPASNKNPVDKTVFLWPFMNSSFVLDMATLAADPEGEALRYTIVSSSFMEGTDYTVDGNILTLGHFSLSKGSFDIKATDPGGLFCNIEVRVTSHNVGIWALIALGVAALVGLGILAVLTHIATHRLWRGVLQVVNLQPNGGINREHNSFRGKLPLSYFLLGACGFDSRKSYFIALPGNQIEFRSNKPFYVNGVAVTKTAVLANMAIYADEDRTMGIKINTKPRI